MIDDIVARLRQTHRTLCKCFGCEAANEIERLRAERDEARRERDEARREVCESEQYCVDRSKEEATRRGWNCYEETP